MAEIHEIKHRLAAVAQTRQITNAMYLISSTRMKHEMRRVEYSKEYFGRARATVKDILEKSRDINHPYLMCRTGDRAAFLIIAGDKGLCGSYNSDVLKFALEYVNAHSVHYIETVGRTATSFFRRQGIIPDAEILGAAMSPSLFTARKIVENLFYLYNNNLVDEIYIIYTRFGSASLQTPTCVRLLPLYLEDYDDVKVEFRYNNTMIYEPSPLTVFNSLVPQYAIGLAFSTLVQSFASEQCARMNAMNAATQNADEMTEKLSHQYNTERQLAITNEIAEITAGAAGAKRQAEMRKL